MASGKISTPKADTSSTTAAAVTEKNSRIYPLYLIPRALNEVIQEKGDTLETISVKRTAGHSYRVDTTIRILTGDKNGDNKSDSGEGSDE